MSPHRKIRRETRGAKNAKNSRIKLWQGCTAGLERQAAAGVSAVSLRCSNAVKTAVTDDTV